MSVPRVLIAGGTGLLGQALLASVPSGWKAHATYHEHRPAVEWRCFRQMDVADERSVLDAFDDIRPDVVVHAASIGSVDLAEREPELVRRVNVGGVETVLRACGRSGTRLVFVSSNAVFDGRQPPYDEQAPRRAANQYGRFKIEAEQLVESSGVPHVIMRPILMYGWPMPDGRSNVVTRWLADLEAERPIEVAEDIVSMPLAASNCAEAVWAAIRLQRGGIYHVAGADCVTLADFARETARVFGKRERLITPVASARFTSLAPRPRDTSFITTKMERDLGVRPMGIHEGLVAMCRTRVVNR